MERAAYAAFSGFYPPLPFSLGFCSHVEPKGPREDHHKDESAKRRQRLHQDRFEHLHVNGNSGFRWSSKARRFGDFFESRFGIIFTPCLLTFLSQQEDTGRE